MKKILAMLPIAVALAGCSGFTKGYYQSVQVTTDPDGATCHFSYGEGPVFSTVSSGGTAYNIHRGNRDLVVTCKKSGYYDGFEVLSASTDPAAYQSFVLFDLPIGTNFEYPDTVHVSLRKI